MKKIKWHKKVADFIDFDYIKKLSPEDRDYLLTFIDEYYCGAGVKKDSLHIEKLGEGIKKSLNKDNNTRTTDLFNWAKQGNNMKQYDEQYHNKIEDEQSEHIDPLTFVDETAKEVLDELGLLEGYELKILKDYAFKIMRFAIQEIKRQEIKMRNEKASKHYQKNKEQIKKDANQYYHEVVKIRNKEKKEQ